MNSRGWSCEGIGFTLYTGDNTEAVLNFLVRHVESLKNTYHSKTYEEVSESILKLNDSYSKDTLSEEELYDELADMFDYNTADIVADIIKAETGLHNVYGYTSDANCDTEETVMFAPAYPWQINDCEIKLTQDDIEKILSKYAVELGLDADSVEEKDLEYYG